MHISPITLAYRKGAHVKQVIALAAVALLVLGCASKDESANSKDAAAQGNQSPFAISTAFNPDPPKQGSEALTITVKDSAGAPVKGALVKITTQMPAMSMSGPAATATDNGDGTYSANLSLQYATSWHFGIAVSSDGKTARSEVVKDVK
jgi:YtkA-like